MGPLDRYDSAHPHTDAPPAAALAATPPAAVLPDERPLQALRARLLAGHSATGTLEQWCSERDATAASPLQAVRMHLQRPAPATVRQALQVQDNTPLHYRRVRLACGGRILSEADNWYLPGLLTPEMNHMLDCSDEPFGRVVGALGFQRETLRDALYWPPRGEPGNGAILEIHALLRDRCQRPFSYVVETYLEQALA